MCVACRASPVSHMHDGPMRSGSAYSEGIRNCPGEGRQRVRTNWSDEHGVLEAAHERSVSRQVYHIVLYAVSLSPCTCVSLITWRILNHHWLWRLTFLTNRQQGNTNSRVVFDIIPMQRCQDMSVPMLLKSCPFIDAKSNLDMG